MRGLKSRPEPLRVIDIKRKIVQSRQDYTNKAPAEKQSRAFHPKKHESINSQISSESFVSGSSMDESIVIEEGIYSKNMNFKEHVQNLMLKQKMQAQTPGRPIKPTYLAMQNSVIEQQQQSEFAESAMGSSRGDNYFAAKNESSRGRAPTYSRQNSLAQTAANNKSRRTSEELPYNSFSLSEKETYKKPNGQASPNRQELMTIPKIGSLYNRFEAADNESNALPISSLIKDKSFVSSNQKLKTPLRVDSQSSADKSASFLSTERQLKIQSQVKQVNDSSWSKHQQTIKGNQDAEENSFKINLMEASSSSKNMGKKNMEARQKQTQDKNITTMLFQTLAPRLSNKEPAAELSEISSPLPSGLESKAGDILQLVFNYSVKSQSNQEIRKLKNGMASQKSLKLKDYLRLTSLSNDAKYDKYAARSLQKIKRISQKSKSNNILLASCNKKDEAQKQEKKQETCSKNKTTIDPCKSIVLIKASLAKSLSNMIDSSTKLFNQIEQNRQLLGYQYDDLVFMCNFHRIYDQNVFQPASLLRELLTEFKRSRKKADDASPNLQQNAIEPYSPRKRIRSPIK